MQWLSARTLAAVGIAVVLMSGCRTIPQRRDPPPPEDLQGGTHAESRERRTAGSRPRPWQEDHGPFEADRTGIAEHRARYEGNREPNAPTERACARLVESYPCPLVAHLWRMRDVPGGIELTVEASRLAAHRLRDALRCHVAYGRTDPDSGCLYRFRWARVAGSYKSGVMMLRVTTDRKSKVAKLRARVRKTVNAAK